MEDTDGHNVGSVNQGLKDNVNKTLLIKVEAESPNVISVNYTSVKQNEDGTQEVVPSEIESDIHSGSIDLDEGNETDFTDSDEFDKDDDNENMLPASDSEQKANIEDIHLENEQQNSEDSGDNDCLRAKTIKVECKDSYDSAYNKDDDSDKRSESETKKRKRTKTRSARTTRATKTRVKTTREALKKEDAGQKLKKKTVPTKKEKTEPDGKKKKRAKRRKENSNQIFQCSECGEKFQSYLERVKHNKVAHVRYHCTDKDCHMTFNGKQPRDRHVRAIHKQIRTYQCHRCASLFKTNSALTAHIYALHTDASMKKSFVCHVCAKVFFSFNKLHQHESIHTGVKDFKCDREGCGKSFRLQSGLFRHLKFHDQIKPYKCKECPQCFTRKGYLMTHMYKHTGVKDFVCDICGKAFSQAGNLRAHKALHTEERSFWGCDYCSKKYSFKSNLSKHMKTHHADLENTQDACHIIMDRENKKARTEKERCSDQSDGDVVEYDYEIQ